MMHHILGLVLFSNLSPCWSSLLLGLQGTLLGLHLGILFRGCTLCLITLVSLGWMVSLEGRSSLLELLPWLRLPVSELLTVDLVLLFGSGLGAGA